MPVNGFVYIVESPSDEDIQARRAEGLVLDEGLALAQIPHRYKLVRDRQELQNALQLGIVEAWRELGEHLSPIVHLSMHGNAEGIQLNRGEFQTWNDLRAILLPLINAMEGRLLICMSSCFGVGGCRMAMHDDLHHPFWALVGNSQTPRWADAAVAYLSFYHLFFIREFDIDVCVGSMNVASGDHNFMRFLGAEARANWVEFVRNRPPVNLNQLVLGGQNR